MDEMDGKRIAALRRLEKDETRLAKLCVALDKGEANPVVEVLNSNNWTIRRRVMAPFR